MTQEARKRNFPCLACRVHVKKTDKAVGCNLCRCWMHKDCADLSDDFYKFLVDDFKARGTVLWMCDSCKIVSKKFLVDITELKKNMVALEATQKKQDDDILKVTIRVNTLEEASKKQSENEGELQDKISACFFAEQKEREIRKDNVVIHNLSEAADDVSSAEARKQADINSVQKLFDKNLVLNQRIISSFSPGLVVKKLPSLGHS